MQRFIEWLLNLDQVRLHDGGQLQWQWQEPIQAWLWFMIVMVVGAYVTVIYRRETISGPRRILLSALRGLSIMLAFILLTKPLLVRRHDRQEPSTVAILFDESASMNRSDLYSPSQWQQLSFLPLTPQTERSVTRWQVVQALLESDHHAALGRLLAHHQLRLFNFSGAISQPQFVQNQDQLIAALSSFQSQQPTGQTTHIAGALQQVFDQCLDAHLSSIVLISDGQPTEQPDWDKVASLSRTRGTPVYVIPIGSTDPIRDLALESVEAENFVYLGDKVAVKAGVRATGIPAGTQIEVTLRDTRSDDRLAEKTLTLTENPASLPIELQFKPRETGKLQLAVSITPITGETELNNNTQQVQMVVVDDQVKVLYVEGYPRFEYRYLKNVLLREPSIVSSILLLSADAEFAQEGQEPIRRFPNSPDELNQYDVILLGDVDLSTGWLSTAQMEQIVDFVNHQGGGFGLIAGERYTPQKLLGTPLEKLLAVELSVDADPQLAQLQQQSFQPRLTATGHDSPIIRLLGDEEKLSDTFNQLPDWYWCYAAKSARPGAEVLLEHPQWIYNRLPVPVVAVGRYGAGTLFYQGSDDSWRWRRYQGEALFDTYWLQTIRFLGRYKKFEADSGFTLRTQKPVVEPQQPVVLTLTFEDAGQLPDSLAIDVLDAQGVRISELALTRLTASSRVFQGSALPRHPGQYDAVFSPQRFGFNLPEAHCLFEISAQSLENKNPQANLQLMEQLTQTTQGQIVQPWQAVNLVDQLPKREYLIPDDVTETIWDSKAALGLFVLLVAAEWILRKWSGLA